MEKGEKCVKWKNFPEKLLLVRLNRTFSKLKVGHKKMSDFLNSDIFSHCFIAFSNEVCF
jgi:hypothetical protein